MYPILCPGGYGVPIKAGHFEICGVVGEVNDTTAASRVEMVDTGTGATVAASDTVANVILPLKGAAGDQNIGGFFPEPIKVRGGISVSYLSNLLPGRTFVYVR